MYQGARLVDTFCWDVLNPVMVAEEFVARTCADLNLPVGFQYRMTLQIVEQLKSYKELIDFIHTNQKLIPNWEAKIRRPQPITLGIRHNNIDYSDKIDWDPMNTYLTPERFARITCADLGLASEIETAISHKIRESLFRWIINIIQNPSQEDTDIQPEFKVTENKVTLVPPSQVVEMTTNLWRRAKPNTLDDVSSVPQPMLPAIKDTNASIWIKRYNLGELLK